MIRRFFYGYFLKFLKNFFFYLSARNRVPETTARRATSLERHCDCVHTRVMRVLWRSALCQRPHRNDTWGRVTQARRRGRATQRQTALSGVR